MQLKNFTVIAKGTKNDAVSPAYDMFVVSLVLPKDPEELALNLNGKIRKLKRQDFNEAMAKSTMSFGYQLNSFNLAIFLYGN
jgi:serine/threonine-protein kinase HipA